MYEGEKNKVYLDKSWISEKLEVRISSIHGKGVFTNDKISKGEVVSVWGGHVVTLEEFQKGSGLQHTNVGIGENIYLVTPNNEEKSIDDYMNHCCDANLWLLDEVTLIAKRDVESNEELFLDYSIEIADDEYRMKNDCECGKENCRKIITGQDWKLSSVQNLYKDHFSPFINEKIKKLNI